MLQVKCKETLFMEGTGEQCFSAGKAYDVENENNPCKVFGFKVIDDRGSVHWIYGPGGEWIDHCYEGGWFEKHFEIVEG